MADVTGNGHRPLSGDIHLDHIKPIACFNLLDPEEVKKAFHFSNLQPLFKVDNLCKRDKLVDFVAQGGKHSGGV